MSSSELRLAAKFPQRIDTGDHASTMSPLYSGPRTLRRLDGARHVRVESVLRAAPQAAGAAFEVGVRAYENRFVQTHETQMYQFTAGESESPLVCEVGYHDRDVVRVRCGSDGLADPYAGIADADRMLISRQKSSLLASVSSDTVTDTDGHSTSATRITPDTGETSICVTHDPFRISILDREGSEIFGQKKRDLFTSDVWDMGIAVAPDASSSPSVAFCESIEIRDGEHFVGLGERFDGVRRNGRPVDFRNKDAIGTSSKRTYINVPFYISSAGYGLFLNSSANPEWGIGVDDLTALDIAIADEQIDYFVIYGPDPATILRRYSELTGFAPVPPVWSFGLWLSRNSYVSWDVVDEVVAEADRRGLPFDVVHLDTAWFKEDWNCDLRFSPDRFSDPEAHLAALRKRGVRVSLWQYNFIPPREDNENFKQARANGYLVTGLDGDSFSYPEDSVGSWIDDQIIDFTNPDASSWYAAQIERLIQGGASAIKVDFGEGVPDNAHYAGMPGSRVHNLYSLIYTRAIAEATHRASGEWIVWARSGTAGSQRYPVHWGGDSQCSWAGLRGTLRAALSIGLSGIPFFSHDIGGFIGRPSAELYVRWAQFGLLSSHSRTHGNGDTNSREPWSFGERANTVFQEFVRLRYTLLPYLLHCANQASATGKPVVRAMLLEFPDDEMTWIIEDQYMLGDALLVAPVLEPIHQSRRRRVYLPKGTWYDYWTGAPWTSAGEWITLDVELERIPIFARAGALIPYTTPRTRTENTILPIESVVGYPGREGEEAVLDLRVEGRHFSYRLRGNRIEETGADRSGARLRVVGADR